MAPAATVRNTAAARLWAGSRRFPGIALVYIGKGVTGAAAFHAWIRRYDEYIWGMEEIMANSARDEASDYNTKIIEEFRANQGRIGGLFAGTPMILIHHVGAKSGVERVTPLACSPQEDGRFVIVASSGGSPAHPAWYHNLKAHPRIKVEVGAETFTVLAEELDDAARAALWPKLVAEAPAIGEHQAKTTRQIPVFMLTRQD